MKVGFEDRRKVYLVVGLIAIAVFLFFKMFTSDSGSTVSAASTPAPALTGDQAASTSQNKPPAKPALNLDPSLRTSTLKSVENQQYRGSGRNIFDYAAVRQPAIPKPQTPVVTNQPPSGPPPPPPPPPINLKFYGFASKPGEPIRIFLSEGEDIFIGGEGDIINRRYKIIHIGRTSVEIEDVLNNNRQSIPLTQG